MTSSLKRNAHNLVAAEASAQEGMSRAGRLFLIVAALFFASGFSSLIYQVVWNRMLVLVFGATSLATSTVLAVFMGGLALGSFAAGRISGRAHRPLFWYGVLEAIIGCWALMTPAMFAAATPLYKSIWMHTHACMPLLSVLRLVCTGLILLVPTTCMGATLPLLSRYVTNSLNLIGSRVGTIYAVNTLGAVAGAAITGFVLLPTMGLHSITLFSAGINFVLFTVVLIISRSDSNAPSVRLSPTDHLDSGESGASSTRAATVQSPAATVILVAFGLSGALAMIYEVCWTRSLLMVIGSSTYAFTVMLTAFLVGIFVGSLVCARWIDRYRHPLLLFALIEVALCVMTIFSMYLFNYLPFWDVYTTTLIRSNADLLLLVRFLFAGCILVPITLCLGAIFPVVVKAYTRDVSSVGTSVGSLYSANTFGAIIGAVLGGFLCLPLWGAEKTLVYGAAINLLIGAAVLWAVKALSMRTKVASTVALILTAGIICTRSEIWDHAGLLDAQASKRASKTIALKGASFETWTKQLRDHVVVKYWADGLCSNVGILYAPELGITSLVTNGHTDGSNGFDKSVQSMVSGFPLLLNSKPNDIAVIGWGTGQTVGTATLFPVRSIEAVELEPNVVEASKFFHDINRKPELDGRVHLSFNDGRNFLLTTDKKFDLIVSEPSNPWQTGVCNLFTVEYFNLCKQRLNSGGQLAVWMQTSEVPQKDLLGVLAALRSNFKNLLGFWTDPGNLVVVASDTPLRIDLKAVQKLLADPNIAGEFNSLGITNAESFVGRVAFSSGENDRLPPGSVSNSDDRNALEFDVGRSYESKQYRDENQHLLSSMFGTPWSLIEWVTNVPAENARTMAEIGMNCLQFGNREVAQIWADRIRSECTDSGYYDLTGALFINEGKFKAALAAYDRALHLDPANTYFLAQHGALQMTLNCPEKAREDFAKALQRTDSDEFRYLMALTYGPVLAGEPYSAKERASARGNTPADKVLQLLGHVTSAQFLSQHTTVPLLMAQACYKLGDLDRAMFYLNHCSAQDMDSSAAKELRHSIERRFAQAEP